MKKILLSCCLLLLYCHNYAQHCNGVMLDTLHGKWKVYLDGIVENTSKPEYKREKVFMEGLNEVVRKNWKWEPLGGNLMYGSYVNGDVGVYRPDPVIRIADNFSTCIGFRNFTCNNGKIIDQPGSGSLNIIFNDLPFGFDLNFYTPGPDDKDGKQNDSDVYTALHLLPEVKDGYFVFTKDTNGQYSNVTWPGNRYRYITITKPGKLPYQMMSKKAYYGKWKIKYRTEVDNIEARSNELASDPKAADLVKASNPIKELYQQYIDKINRLLKTKSAEQLAQPAYQGEELAEYYESIEATPYKAVIVIPNYDYYNFKSNNRAAVQVITIKLEYDNPVFNSALGNSKDFDLLTEKLKPLIVQ